MVFCAYCKKKVNLPNNVINRNKRRGYNTYCNKTCFKRYRDTRKHLVKCSICGDIIERYIRNKTKNKKYYCINCRGLITVPCANCKQLIIKTKYECRTYKNVYCSNKCRTEGSRKTWNDLSRSMLKLHWIMLYGIESLICVRCGHNKIYNIELHHKKYICNGGDNNPNNLEPLCLNCHGEEHYNKTENCKH